MALTSSWEGQAFLSHVQWSMLQNFFPSSLTTRPNKLEGLSLETLSSQVLEFEGRPEPTQWEHLSDAFFLIKLLMLPANIRLDRKVIARYKHSSLFGLVISNAGKKFYNIDTRWTLNLAVKNWKFENICNWMHFILPPGKPYSAEFEWNKTGNTIIMGTLSTVDLLLKVTYFVKNVSKISV